MTALTQPTQISINIHYAKTHLSRIVEEVASTGQAITIAKAGKPKVMIVPIDDKPVKREMGTLKGKIKIPNNFDVAFADEIADMFEGSS